eukprot:1072024-Prymnesium_polylepis.1
MRVHLASAEIAADRSSVRTLTTRGKDSNTALIRSAGRRRIGPLSMGRVESALAPSWPRTPSV